MKNLPFRSDLVQNILIDIVPEIKIIGYYLNGIEFNLNK